MTGNTVKEANSPTSRNLQTSGESYQENSVRLHKTRKHSSPAFRTKPEAQPLHGHPSTVCHTSTVGHPSTVTPPLSHLMPRRSHCTQVAPVLPRFTLPSSFSTQQLHRVSCDRDMSRAYHFCARDSPAASLPPRDSTSTRPTRGGPP